ncbi:MAG: GIY-YIG nuclease family protein [Candidatus Marinimicrobia bacterium]|nr:GIY-YIG nuclease family protein [Candidatus Neomarinimicrobiota bacterium]
MALYIGKAESFKSRLDNHERWDDAVRAGATHIHAMVVATESERRQIEALLIRNF